MRKSNWMIGFIVLFSVSLAIMPSAIPQIGTYEFKGAPGNVKILKVNTVDNQSLSDLFGSGWVSVIELFGPGAANLGARSKSLVTAVNKTTKYLTVYDAASYNTSNWGWTTGAFSATPDSTGDIVTSVYDPTVITFVVNFYFSMNVTVQNAAALMAQLPTSVDQYLGAIVWEPKWQNIGNTVVHHAVAGDWNVPFYSFQYLENCTEIWTYDRTYGAWIGYKILDDTNTKIYEFSIELGGIPGFDFSITLGVTLAGAIGIIFVLMKKKKI